MNIEVYMSNKYQISTLEMGLQTGPHSRFPKTQQGQQLPNPLLTFTETSFVKSPFCIIISGHFDEKPYQLHIQIQKQIEIEIQIQTQIQI